MFDFLKRKIKKEDENTDENVIVASITYYIREDGSPFADVNMLEMDEKATKLLTDLLVGLARHEYLETTIDMIKDHFIKTDNLDLYLTMAGKIARLYDQGITQEEEPCIKPSDAL
jgi:hypothetical protein